MGPLDIESVIASFRSRFRAAGNPERASFEQKYHKTDKLFHGVSVGEIRKTAKDFKRAHKNLPKSELFGLTDKLWNLDYFDLRSLAIALHEVHLEGLDSSDLPRLEEMLRDSSGWGHIDWICVRLVDPLLERDPGLKRYLVKWAADPNYWMRRSALLGQLIQLRSGQGDFELFSKLAIPMLAEKEFFIRKAIGWVVREVSKKRPELTFEFLKENLKDLSPLTFKEGSRLLPEEKLSILQIAWENRKA